MNEPTTENIHLRTIAYDKENDALYIRLRKLKRGESTTPEYLTDWLVIDYADDGTPVGIEIIGWQREESE